MPTHGVGPTDGHTLPHLDGAPAQLIHLNRGAGQIAGMLTRLFDLDELLSLGLHSRQCTGNRILSTCQHYGILMSWHEALQKRWSQKCQKIEI